MPSLSILIQDVPAYETSDAATVACVRQALVDMAGEAESYLVGAHELAGVLRAAGRGMWADRFGAMEEPSMVRVMIGELSGNPG